MKVVIYMAKRDKEKTKNKNNISSALLEIPDISIISNREISVFGTKGVIEYTPELIKLNCGHLLITIKGCDLNMMALSIEEVIIKGVITDIVFFNC